MAKKIMKNIKPVSSLFCFVSLFTVGSALAADCQDLSGVWMTKEGSKITISKNDSGMMSGTYQLDSKIDPVAYPLIGFTNNKPHKSNYDNTLAISFVVHWGKLGSVSSWTGVCRSEGHQAVIETIGHQVRPIVRQRNEHMHSFAESFVAQ